MRIQKYQIRMDMGLYTHAGRFSFTLDACKKFIHLAREVFHTLQNFLVELQCHTFQVVLLTKFCVFNVFALPKRAMFRDGPLKVLCPSLTDFAYHSLSGVWFQRQKQRELPIKIIIKYYNIITANIIIIIRS